jgi:hypothetical protein
VYGGILGNGVATILYGYKASTNQMWAFTPTGDGFYRFSPASDLGASLTLKDELYNDQDPIVQWNWQGLAVQQWTIAPADDQTDDSASTTSTPTTLGQRSSTRGRGR